MKKLSTGLLVTLLAVSSQSTAAEGHFSWDFGATYDKLSDNRGYNFNADIISVSAGYRYVVNNSLSITPQIKIGTGIGNDSLGKGTALAGFDDQIFDVDFITDIEVDHFLELGVRFEERRGDFYGYLTPSYANLEVTTTAYSQAVGDVTNLPAEALTRQSNGTSADWSMGIGLGFGYYVNDDLSFEVGYQRYEDTSLVSAGLRYRLD